MGTAAAAAVAKSLQSRLTLCDPIDGSPPGSPVPGILQARTLERWGLVPVKQGGNQDIRAVSVERRHLTRALQLGKV